MVRVAVLLAIVLVLSLTLVASPSSGEPVPAATSKVYLPLVAKARPNEQVVIAEDFEGAFPGLWQLAGFSPGGDVHWGKRDCRAARGLYSGWAVGGSGLLCGANYPDGAETWMYYGPFSMVDATAGWIDVDLWYNFPDATDRISVFLSTDFWNFYGYRTNPGPGSSGGWEHWEISVASITLGTDGSPIGKPSLYVAFRFLSDDAGSLPEGAYIDNIRVTKQVQPGGASAPAVGAQTQANGSLVPEQVTLRAPLR